MKQTVVTLDLEGVLVPEIWIAFAEHTGIDELRLTTRDIADYDELMSHRLRILAKHNLKLADIQGVIAQLSPMPGAKEFLDSLREEIQVIILSDTFNQFAKPLMAQLGWPTIFCHELIVEDAAIVGYQLRQKDQKKVAVQALQSLNFAVVAAGDSHNDLAMLQQAETGILFCPPQILVDSYPELPMAWDYDDLKREIDAALLEIRR